MSYVWAIYKRETRGYFASPLAWAGIAAFLAIQGALFLFATGQYERLRLQASMRPTLQMPSVESLARDLLGSDIIWALFLIVPLITMRLLAEEKKQHTAELLLTAPMTTRQLVAGKFLGAATVLAIMLALSAWMPGLLRLWGGCDGAVIVGGYTGAFLYGSCLLALGLLASSLTESSMIAALLALLFLALVNIVAQLVPTIPYIGPSLERFTPIANLHQLAGGVLDTQALVYFLTFLLFVLDLTARVLDSQRWR